MTLAEDLAPNLRAIAAMSLPDIVRSAVKTDEAPQFMAVDPRGLLVDETYQRNLSERSMRLIRRIVAGWDWKAFKPPIVVEVAEGYHLIDGQHTAIAAASIPEIDRIPVMVVKAESRTDRAMAFVKHNRDRLTVTATQVHFAMVAAGDEDALTIASVCEKAGARVVKTQPYNGRYRVGDTMSVSGLKAIIGRRYAQGARRVLEICVHGGLAPISVTHMRGVEELLFGKEYAGQIEGDQIAEVMHRMGEELDRDTARFAAEHGVPMWRAYASSIFRNARKRRGTPSRAA